MLNCLSVVLNVLSVVLNVLSWQGCAILYVDRSHHDIIRPLLVSWGYGYGFNSEFAWTGKLHTLDD